MKFVHPFGCNNDECSFDDNSNSLYCDETHSVKMTTKEDLSEENIFGAENKMTLTNLKSFILFFEKCLKHKRTGRNNNDSREEKKISKET